MSFCLFSCPRADARDSEGFLENDLARKLCKRCHGHQLGGSGQGKGTIFLSQKNKALLGVALVLMLHNAQQVKFFLLTVAKKGIKPLRNFFL